MDIVWSTAGLPAAERVSGWSDALSRLVVPVRAEVPRPGRFRGEFRLRRFGPSSFLRVTSSAGQTIHRTAAEIGPGDGDWLFVSTMLRGSGWLHHRGGILREPGDGVTFVDGSQPFALQFRAGFSFISALLPRRDLVALLPPAARAHGSILPAPAGPALHGFLATLETAVDNAVRAGRAADDNRLYDHFLGLAAAALAPAAEAGDDAATADQKLLGRIRAHLVGRLDEPFDGPALAARFGLSPRKLQRLFAAEGSTPTLWLRRQRLERCARDLADPRQQGRSITVIATAYGFDDMAYFSRIFRAAYGMAPGAWRQNGSGMAVVQR